MNKKIIGTILIVIILAGIMIAVFTLNPQKPGITENGSSTQNNFLNQPGISNVQKFTDNTSSNTSSNASGGTIIKNTIIKNTIISGGVGGATPTPLPYPRISINYTIDNVGSIRNVSPGDNSTFAILSLDIRNYGYKYFDAHPTKFRMIIRDKTIEPIVNVTTGSMIDAVIPNNSRAKGDLIFLLSLKDAQVDLYYCKIRYLGDYKIIYSYGIPYEGEATPTVTGYGEYP